MTKKRKPFWLYTALEDTEHPLFLRINNLLALVTLISVALVALETVAALAQYETVFFIGEYMAVTIFSIEYLLRLRFSPHTWRYVFSFYGLIDLIAIIPSFLGFANFTFLKAVRSVRIIRFLRILRLTKFAHIKRRKHAEQSLYKINLEIYFFSLLFAVLILGSLFYLFEGAGHAPDIPNGMYWTLKAIIGGLNYPQPETLGGTITLILARFTSMILLGMTMSLVALMIRKLLIGSEKDS